MIEMNAADEPIKPTPAPRRAPRKLGDQSPKVAPTRVAKSKDSGKTKVSFYLDASTAGKLAVAAILRQSDQSDVANEILTRALSSVTFYDRPAKPACDTGEDRSTEAAA